MKILVTGTKGQVSRCLQERAAGREDVEVIAVGRPELDLLKPETIGEVVASYMPDIVVSAAAYTAVDQAEDEPEIAFAVNEVGARSVAEAARVVGAPIIHLSTDYVFSGDKGRPYEEQDAPDPKCVYGASKLAGERAVADANDRHMILRTAWVYSPYGKNFVTTMLKLAKIRDEISVVDDQVGNPTSAFDVADAILHISQQVLTREKSSNYGIYNLVGEGAVNWCEFAQIIMKLSRACGGPHAVINPIPSSAFPTKAMRPSNSSLQNKKLASVFGRSTVCWETSLRNTLCWKS